MSRTCSPSLCPSSMQVGGGQDGRTSEVAYLLVSRCGGIINQPSNDQPINPSGQGLFRSILGSFSEFGVNLTILEMSRVNNTKHTTCAEACCIDPRCAVL